MKTPERTAAKWLIVLNLALDDALNNRQDSLELVFAFDCEEYIPSKVSVIFDVKCANLFEFSGDLIPSVVTACVDSVE